MHEHPLLTPQRQSDPPLTEAERDRAMRLLLAQPLRTDAERDEDMRRLESARRSMDPRRFAHCRLLSAIITCKPEYAAEVEGVLIEAEEVIKTVTAGLRFLKGRGSLEKHPPFAPDLMRWSRQIILVASNDTLPLDDCADICEVLIRHADQANHCRKRTYWMRDMYIASAVEAVRRCGFPAERNPNYHGDGRLHTASSIVVKAAEAVRGCRLPVERSIESIWRKSIWPKSGWAKNLFAKSVRKKAH